MVEKVWAGPRTILIWMIVAASIFAAYRIGESEGRFLQAEEDFPAWHGSAF